MEHLVFRHKNMVGPMPSLYTKRRFTGTFRVGQHTHIGMKCMNGLLFFNGRAMVVVEAVR
jgi:hypothetical protein